MSKYSTTRSYHCINDCRREGCPGHEVKLEYYITTDSVNIYVDNTFCTTFDENLWRALVNMDNSLREGK